MKPADTRHGKVAFEFAKYIVDGNYNAAHCMLDEKLRNEWNPDSLKEEFEDMIDYGEGPVNHIEVMNEMTDWPSEEDNDIGWAYVALSGENFSEAVAVVVCQEVNQFKIKEIEWGRP